MNFLTEIIFSFLLVKIANRHAGFLRKQESRDPHPIPPLKKGARGIRRPKIPLAPGGRELEREVYSFTLTLPLPSRERNEFPLF
jgi:hypothetical protein